jgi:hypothetical protein
MHKCGKRVSMNADQEAIRQLTTLLNLVQNQASTINTLWNFYITVSLAIAGWFAAAGRERVELLQIPSRIVIVVAFAAFTWVNIFSLSANYGLLDSFLADVQRLLPRAMPDAPHTADALVPICLFVWSGFGVPISLLVELVVWILISLLILFFGRKSF